MQKIEYAAEAFVHEDLPEQVRAGQSLLAKLAGDNHLLALMRNIENEVGKRVALGTWLKRAEARVVEVLIASLLQHRMLHRATKATQTLSILNISKLSTGVPYFWKLATNDFLALFMLHTVIAGKGMSCIGVNVGLVPMMTGVLCHLWNTFTARFMAT